jgi:methyl-accepting chemotaxis protein
MVAEYMRTGPETANELSERAAVQQQIRQIAAQVEQMAAQLRQAAERIEQIWQHIQ